MIHELKIVGPEAPEREDRRAIVIYETSCDLEDLVALLDTMSHSLEEERADHAMHLKQIAGVVRIAPGHANDVLDRVIRVVKI